MEILDSLVSRKVDCAIIGAGPAGTTAAIYLARFRRQVALFDSGSSRISLIPISHNVPGYPDGINGANFIQQMHLQASRYGVSVIPMRIETLNRDQNDFVLSNGKNLIFAKTVVLATGAVDTTPPFQDTILATQKGFLRHCPICDAYEMIDKKIAILGNDSKTIREVQFLSTYTSDTSILTLGKPFSQDAEKALTHLNIKLKIITEPIINIAKDSDRFYGVETDRGTILGRALTLFILK